MKNSKDLCDCWIGILNSYDQTDENNLNINSYISKLKTLSDLTLIFAKDYIDKRKGLSTLFNFCPNCGKKINWVKLRNKF